MREIKFRGKAKSTLEELTQSEIYNKNGWVFGSYIDGRIINGVLESTEEYIAIETWCPIIPETLGQYTGLKDSKGKEIYEGDIISNGREIAEVKFYEGCFMAQIEEGYAEAVFDYCIPFDDSCVVGNIYENPELLGGEK